VNGETLSKLFRNEKFLRIAHPTATILGLVAGVWHGSHALSAWRQSEQWKTANPDLSDFFWSAFQTELGTALAAIFAAYFARIVFDVRRLRRNDSVVVPSDRTLPVP
jgi:hypothetical protein